MPSGWRDAGCPVVFPGTVRASLFQGLARTPGRGNFLPTLGKQKPTRWLRVLIPITKQILSITIHRYGYCILFDMLRLARKPHSSSTFEAMEIRIEPAGRLASGTPGGRDQLRTPSSSTGWTATRNP
jgi:hypothetical protein